MPGFFYVKNTTLMTVFIGLQTLFKNSMIDSWKLNQGWYYEISDRISGPSYISSCSRFP